MSRTESPARSAPDPRMLRAMIARDLAALDPWRRRRYRARLERLMREAQTERDAARRARATRSASSILTAGLGFALAAFLGIAAMLDLGAAPMLRGSLVVAALCAAMVGWDASRQAGSPARRRADPADAVDPAEAALALHRAAYAPLGYAVDLPPAREGRRLSRRL